MGILGHEGGITGEKLENALPLGKRKQAARYGRTSLLLLLLGESVQRRKLSIAKRGSFV